jgi:hypothetical protein
MNKVHVNYVCHLTSYPWNKQVGKFDDSVAEVRQMAMDRAVKLIAEESIKK